MPDMLWRLYILDMSNYSENYDRTYRNERESGRGINNLTWSNSSEGKSKFWCTLCRVKLIASPKPNEKDMLWCKECGHSFDKKVQQTTKPINKSRSPSSANSGSFIISQKRKATVRRIDSVNNELSDEDLNDLRSMGFTI
jgi:transcription elongation factor Elf1